MGISSGAWEVGVSELSDRKSSDVEIRAVVGVHAGDCREPDNGAGDGQHNYRVCNITNPCSLK